MGVGAYYFPNIVGKREYKTNFWTQLTLLLLHAVLVQKCFVGRGWGWVLIEFLSFQGASFLTFWVFRVGAYSKVGAVNRVNTIKRYHWISCEAKEKCSFTRQRWIPSSLRYWHESRNAGSSARSSNKIRDKMTWICGRLAGKTNNV